MIGNHVRVKVVKNKVAPPFREAEFDIMFGKGISREGDILDLAVKENIVEKSGAWYSYQGNKIGQGRENAKTFFTNNPAVMEEVEKKVRIHYGFEEGDPEGEKQEGGKKTDKKADGKQEKRSEEAGAAKTEK